MRKPKWQINEEAGIKRLLDTMSTEDIARELYRERKRISAFTHLLKQAQDKLVLLEKA